MFKVKRLTNTVTQLYAVPYQYQRLLDYKNVTFQMCSLKQLAKPYSLFPKFQKRIIWTKDTYVDNSSIQT